MSLPTTAILAAGSMIASSINDAGSAARCRADAVPIGQLLTASKFGLERLVNMHAEQVAQIDNKGLTFDVWERLVARIRHWIDVEHVGGVIITHGTDTLEEAATLLHLAQQTDTPIVLTAAMRPSTLLSANGPLNLLNTVRFAASPSACGHGVLVALNRHIHAARDVQKGHTYTVEALISPDAEPVSFVFDAQIQFQQATQRVTAEDILPVPSASQWPWIEVLASYVQPDARVADALVVAGMEGLVIATTGAGSIHANLGAALNRASQQGVFVLRSARIGADMMPAQPGAERWAANGSLNPCKARVLLTSLLSSGRAQAEVASLQQVIDRY